ncbi:MAG: hypothetical protein V1761_01210 [bacterium]
MKKVFATALAALCLFLLSACEQAPAMTVIVPSGSPALAQIYIQNGSKYDVDLVNGADPLVAAFGSGSHDVIFAPTNLGAKMIASGSAYVYAGAVVWGNYYLVTTGRDAFTFSDLQGATIYAFGPNQTSDIILRHLLTSLEITAELIFPPDPTVATLAAMFAADPTLIVMTAEPSLSTIQAAVTGVQIIDLQEVYEFVSGTSAYPQAGVFLRSGLDTELASEFLSDLEASITAVNADPVTAAAIAVGLNFGFTAAVMAVAIPGSHLDFVSAVDSRNAIEAYFTIILGMNAALIGGSLPGDAFYYQP